MPDSSPPESHSPLSIYNPGSLSPDALLAEFIGRKHQLHIAMEIVRANRKGEAQQHLLVVGPRGMGKTMLLLALAYTVQRDATLGKEWLPVIFPEETYGIGDLADFWLYATEHLLRATENEAALHTVDTLRDTNPEDIEDQAKELFLSHLAKTGKRALILLENLNDFFDTISDEAQQHRLRAFLMEDDRVMLAASSPSYFSAHGNMDMPFYDFFRIIHLERFNKEEMIEVLSELAKIRKDSKVLKVIENQPERINSLRILTRGNPRLVKIIYRMLSEGAEGSAREDLERLLEDCTPYFKHRIEELKPESRRVFDHVAKHWDPVTVGDIQKALRRPSNKISIYLKRLVDQGFIEEAEASTAKRKSYQVAERFYNIYYLMRFSRAGKRRLAWLVQAMRVLYSPEDFQQWTQKTLEAWRGNKDARLREDRAAFLYSLTQASDSVGMQREILDKSIAVAWDEDKLQCLNSLIDQEMAKQTLGDDWDLIQFLASLPEEQKQIFGYRPEDARWWYLFTWPLEARSLFKLAERAYRKAIELDPKFAFPWNGLGSLFKNHLNRPEEAEDAFRKAIELDPKCAFPWNGLGNLLADRLNRPEEAEDAYRKAIKLDPKYAFPHAGLSDVLSRRGDDIGACASALQAALLDPDSSWPRSQFLKVCGGNQEAWLTLLPKLLERLSASPRESADVFEFALRGLKFLLKEKQLTPSDACELIETHGASEAFDDILLALRAIESPDILQKASPERRAFAQDFIKAIQ